MLWRMMKKIICVVFFAVSLLLMAGCGRHKEAFSVGERLFNEPVYDWGKSTGETLTVWGAYPDLDRTYIRKAFERYTQLTGNELSIVQMPKEEFTQQMLAAFGGGEAEPPDIILSYGGTNIEAYDPDENFYDFSDALWLDDLTDTSINQTVYNGRIIGLPHWEASVSGTLYNKEIFKKYDLEVPKTQEEFMNVCASLSKQGITPVYLPAGEVSMLLYQFPLDAVVENAGILNGLNDGSLGYEDLPQMAQIVQWYKTMADAGYFGDAYEDNDWDGMNTAMSSGKYAMMLCWDTWLYTDFDGSPEDFGLMPAFVGIPENGTFEGPNLGLFIVNRHTKRLDAALNFITFLSDPYNYNAAFEDVYTAPVFKNQVASISTPQYMEAEMVIERNFRDSTAWLRIRGFSQNDAQCILDYMAGEGCSTVKACLERMDELRAARLKRVE